MNAYEYDIFGNPILTIETHANAIRYSGEFYDAETGLYYLRARYYAPYIGRFITEDTYKGDILNPLSLNLYTYVHNDPINFWDPTGHWQASDAYELNPDAQAKIIALTNAYFEAKTKDERDRIHDEAEAIRRDPSSQRSNTIITPIVVQAAKEVQYIVEHFASGKTYTKEEWEKLTRQANITSESRESGKTTTTTTNIGYTNLVVSVTHDPSLRDAITPYNFYQPDYKYGTRLTMSTNYDAVTGAKRTFVDEVKTRLNGVVNEEQAVTILALVEQDPGFSEHLMKKYNPSSYKNNENGYTSTYIDIDTWLLNKAMAGQESSNQRIKDIFNKVVKGSNSTDADEFVRTLVKAKGGSNYEVVEAFLAKEAFLYDYYNQQKKINAASYEAYYTIREIMMSVGPVKSTPKSSISKTPSVNTGSGNTVKVTPSPNITKTTPVTNNANKITDNLYYNYANQATKNPYSKEVVLGKYNQGGVSYTRVAEQRGATYFQLDNWDNVVKEVGENNIWRINESFIRQQASAGKSFILSHDPAQATGYFAKEVKLLRDMGYSFVRDGSVWRAVK